jgi:hypothetical protein
MFNEYDDNYGVLTHRASAPVTRESPKLLWSFSRLSYYTHAMNAAAPDGSPAVVRPACPAVPRRGPEAGVIVPERFS